MINSIATNATTNIAADIPIAVPAPEAMTEDDGGLDDVVGDDREALCAALFTCLTSEGVEGDGFGDMISVEGLVSGVDGLGGPLGRGGDGGEPCGVFGVGGVTTRGGGVAFESGGKFGGGDDLEGGEVGPCNEIGRAHV